MKSLTPVAPPECLIILILCTARRFFYCETETIFLNLYCIANISVLDWIDLRLKNTPDSIQIK